MLVALLAMASTKVPFQEDFMLRAAGFRDKRASGHQVWVSERTATSFQMHFSTLCIWPTGNESEDEPRFHVFSPDSTEATLSGRPVGRYGYLSDIRHELDEMRLSISGDDYGVSAVINVDRIEDLPAGDFEAIGNHCRWFLARLESPFSTATVLWRGREFRSYVGWVPIRAYASTQGWAQTYRHDMTQMEFATPRGDLTVHVGSDAVEWQGKVIRTGEVHMVNGDEVYLPVELLEECGL